MPAIGLGVEARQHGLHLGEVVDEMVRDPAYRLVRGVHTLAVLASVRAEPRAP